jgi:hypothetical protein
LDSVDEMRDRATGKTYCGTLRCSDAMRHTPELCLLLGAEMDWTDFFQQEFPLQQIWFSVCCASSNPTREPLQESEKATVVNCVFSNTHLLSHFVAWLCCLAVICFI